MDKLQVLRLTNNKVGYAGMTALATALGSGALSKCTSIGIKGNPASKEAQQAVKDALREKR